MRQGFDFYVILKLKKVNKWDFEIWKLRNLNFGLINYNICLDEGMKSWKVEFIYCLSFLLFMKFGNLEDETGSF